MHVSTYLNTVINFRRLCFGSPFKEILSTFFEFFQSRESRGFGLFFSRVEEVTSWGSEFGNMVEDLLLQKRGPELRIDVGSPIFCRNRYGSLLSLNLPLSQDRSRSRQSRLKINWTLQKNKNPLHKV